jgi:hypothetical protein
MEDFLMNEYKQYMYEMFPDARPHIPLLEKEGEDKPITSAGGQEPISKAAEDARKLGLHHTAYGYWADSTGKVVAQSVKLSDGSTQLVRLNRDVPADSKKKGSTDDPTSVDDLDLDDDPDSDTTSEVSSNKETLNNLGALQKNFPEKFKEFLKFAFARRHSLGRNPVKQDVIYGDPDNPKKLELFRLGPKSKIGAFPGLMGGAKGDLRPTHLLLGKKAIPLVYTNKTDPSKSFNIYDDVIAAAMEFNQELQSGQPVKVIPPSKKTVDTPQEQPEVTYSTRTIDNPRKMQGLIDCIKINLSNYAQAVQRGDKGFTPEKLKHLTDISTVVNEFLQNPTKEMAEKMALEYEIGTNSVDAKIQFGVLHQYNTEKKETLEKWFDRSIDVFSKMSAEHALTKGIINQSSNTQGALLVSVLKEVLGGSYEKHIFATVSLNDMLLPSIAFKDEPVVSVTPTITKRISDDADVLNIGGVELPLYFDEHDSDDNIRMILEALNLEEQKVRSLAAKTGSLRGISNPQEHDIQRIAKDAADSILIYQKRLQILEKFKGDCIQFNGLEDVPKYIEKLKFQFMNQARRVEDGPLNDEQLRIVNMLDSFAEIPTGVNPDDDMQIKWKQFANIFARDERLRYTAVSLTEHLSAISSLRNGKTVLLPKSTNVQVIDHIAVKSLGNERPSIEDLINIEGSVNLILTSVDLTSVKSSVKGNVSKKTGELLTSTDGGGTPAISGLLDYHEFDPRIDKSIIDFFKQSKVEEKYAKRKMEDCLNDSFMRDLLCKYYNVDGPSDSIKVSRLKTKLLDEYRPKQKAKESLEKYQNRLYEYKQQQTSVILGCIGEAILNAGKTYQLLQNQTFSDTYVRISDSKDQVLKFKYAHDSAKGSLSSYKMRLQAQTSVDDSRRATIEEDE